MEIRGRGVLITGASRGLGAALAHELGAAGARLVLVARGVGELEAVAAAVSAAGGEAHAFAADVGDKNAVYAIAGAAAELAGPIDVVIHNASRLGKTPMPSLLDTDCEDLEQVLAVNLVGPFRLTKALAGSMAIRGGGLVLQVSSDAAVSAYSGWGAYSVSKAALDHLGRIWAAELENAGVRFLSIDPGEMDTRMHAEAIPDADRSSLLAPAVVARRIARLIERAETLPPGARVVASEDA